MSHYFLTCLFFRFNDPAHTLIYSLSLHDALPIFLELKAPHDPTPASLAKMWPTFFAYVLSFVILAIYWVNREDDEAQEDRKSTRLNSSHRTISYAVFCLKKKKKNYC